MQRDSNKSNKECAKKSYLTKEEAIKKIADIKSEDGDHKKPIRSYRCDKCGNFHLTSWSKKTKKKIANYKIINKERRIESLAKYWIKKKGWDNEN